MKEKFVIILGAGLLQKPAFLAAKELGLKICVADANKNAVCVPLANVFCNIDLKNREALADFCVNFKKEHNLCAVFTAGTDFSASVSYIAEKCNLPAHSFSATVNATDKIKMRECLKKSGVSVPNFKGLSENDLIDLKKMIEQKGKEADLCEILQTDLHFPLVVKPVDNMGARGCKKVCSLPELLDACQTAIKCSFSRRIIVENFLEGPEFSIDSLIYDDIMIITGFADRIIHFPPYFVEMGHSMPTQISEIEQFKIVSEFRKGCDALGLSCGACKGDLKLTKGIPAIGEIAARLSGGYMSGWTFPYASGFDLTKAALEIACGIKPKIFAEESLAKMQKITKNTYLLPCKKFSEERAFISMPGKVKKIHGTDNFKKNENFKDFFPRIKEGDEVTFPCNNVEKCGNVITCADTRKKACESAEECIKSIVVELEYPNEKTENFLSKNSIYPPNAFDFDKNAMNFLSKISDFQNVDTTVPLSEQLPDSFYFQAMTLQDWNGKSVAETFCQFSKFAKPAKIPAKKFWQTFCKAGLQGILYLSEKYFTER